MVLAGSPEGVRPLWLGVWGLAPLRKPLPEGASRLPQVFSMHQDVLSPLLRYLSGLPYGVTQRTASLPRYNEHVIT